MSAADVTAINAHTDQVAKDLKYYLACLLVGSWNDGKTTHPGIALVVEQNQRDVRAVAKTLNTAAPAAVPVTLTDAQVAQITASIPPATLAAIAAQWNK